ncbi:type I-E CRISPR-associated protein Cse2/CasB [Streptomyces lavendulae]|uniref:type I-E CRISPR-associated protein Cse2/CasB n=1 Tax=Streptomyces lavendulae TaxID=1914 RepID=UPI0038232A35
MTASTVSKNAAPWFWVQFEAGQPQAGSLPPGRDIAMLTQGLTKPAGLVPEMWRYHRTAVDDDLAARGIVTDTLVAEHMALALFGAHQQGKGQLMHRPGVRLGTAARALHERYSESGVDELLQSAAKARTLAGLFLRLRALVSMLAAVGQPLDYTQLLYDLRSWPDPDRRARTIRAWGFTYRPWIAPEKADGGSV